MPASPPPPEAGPSALTSTGKLPASAGGARDAPAGTPDPQPSDSQDTGDDAGHDPADRAPGASQAPAAAAPSHAPPAALPSPLPATLPAGRTPRAPRGTGTRLTALTSAESGFPWERSPLSGIPSTKILAELQRRRERSAALLAERDRVVELMDAIEAELQAIGHDVDSLAAGEGGPARGTRPAKTGPARAGRTAGPSGAKRTAAPQRERRGAGRGRSGGRAGSAAGSGRAPGVSRAPRGTSALSLKDAIAQAIEPRALVTPAEAAELVRKNGYASSAKNFGMLVANTLAKDARFRRVGRGSYERIG
ncbi:MAG TPA: hypothetical protein VK824_09970 [Planctomycetota bacterium]|nr:hypothetical protein [Planctomycetota bacterium]